jgi:hypothetical protein
MEKSPQDNCVGSLPFDYSLFSNGGLPADAGRDATQTDLEEPEPPQETPADEEEETRRTRTRTIAYFNDDILAADCKSLINRKAIHLTALKLANERYPAEEGKPPRFSRVSQKFIDAFEQVMRAELYEAIQRHPSPLFTNTLKEF